LSSEKIKPFPLTKLIAYYNYVDKYKSKHFKVSRYYGHLNSEEYRKYISQMNLVEESKYLKKVIIKMNFLKDFYLLI